MIVKIGDIYWGKATQQGADVNYWARRGKKEEAAGENCIVMRFVVGTLIEK